MRRLAVVMVGLVGFGCSTAAKPPEEPAPVVVPPLPRASASGELSLGLPPPPPPLPPLPRHPAGEDQPTTPVATIGAACTDPSACGKSGKVAVVYTGGYRFAGQQGMSCKPVSTMRDGANMSSACVEGDRILVTSSCIMCRMPSGEQLVGLVADMTPAQLARAQKLAGLPDAPLLTTTAAWSEAIATAAKKTGNRTL